MLAVALIAFTLFNYVGDPIKSMVGQDTSLAVREQMRQELGLNDSVIVQFARFVGHAARGEFGLSYQQGRPVGQIILERMPATLELSFVSATLALALGVPLGIYTGLHRRSWVSQGLLAVSLVGVSLPTFLIGILLILVFAVDLEWLPSFGRGTVVHFGWWTTGLLDRRRLARHILPAVTLGAVSDALIMRLVRAEMIEVSAHRLHQVCPRPRAHQPGRQFRPRAEEHTGAGDNGHRTPARLDHRLRHHHRDRVPVARHGSDVHPGGDFADIPVMAAYLMLVGCFFVVINLVVDLLYHVIDPRLRIDRERAV